MRDTIVNFATQRPLRSDISKTAGKKPRIDSDHLFQGSTEIVIIHQKEEYNLRVTRNGKLILTK